MVHQCPGHIDQNFGGAKAGGADLICQTGCSCSLINVIPLVSLLAWNTGFFPRKNMIAFLFILWVFFLTYHECLFHYHRSLSNILLMILHGRRVLYEILLGLFLARLLGWGGVGWGGVGWRGIFYRHPGTPRHKYMEVICCTVSNVVIFFYLCLVMIFSACFSFSLPF